MATATVYIDGEILPEAYIWPGEQATSLFRVREQIQAAGEFDDIELYIYSPGGYCVEGWAIYDYLLNLNKPIKAIGYGGVASIATVFFLAGNERLISPNCEFMVHLPWGMAVGNQHDIQTYLDSLVTESDKIISLYADKTGLAPDVLAEKMLADWFMNAEQAQANGFATGIWQPGETVMAHYAKQKPRAEQKPVFLLNLDKRSPNPNSTAPKQYPNTTMSKIKTKGAGIMASLKNFMALLDGEEVKALDVSLGDGRTLVVETTGDTPTVGNTATIDGETAPDGDYLTEDGATVTVVDGIITAIVEPASDSADPVPVVDPVAVATQPDSELQAKFDALNAEFTQFKAQTRAVLGTLHSQEIPLTAPKAHVAVSAKATETDGESARKAMLDERKARGVKK